MVLRRNVATAIGKDVGGDAGASVQQSQRCSADYRCFSLLDTDGGLTIDLLKETPSHAVWEDAESWISHLAPPFSACFQQSCLAAERKGRERLQLHVNGLPNEKPGRG